MTVRTRLVLLALAITMCWGCSPVASGNLQTESRTVPAAGVSAAIVDLTMGAGELEVTGGAQELLEADFTFNVARWTPDFQVTQTGDRTTVQIEQGNGRIPLPSLGNSFNRWEIRLSPDVPLTLNVRLGAGNTLLQLGGLALERLDVTMGAGEAEVDLTGPWERNLLVNVTGGVGQLRVELPADVGVRASVSGGLGTVRVEGLRSEGGVYVNDAYGESGVTLDLTVRGGVGEVALTVGQSTERT